LEFAWEHPDLSDRRLDKVLQRIKPLAPVIEETGGRKALEETISAIIDVGNWCASFEENSTEGL
jgi:hypothetical protein